MQGTAPTTRRLTTAKGAYVDTTLTNQEALQVLPNVDSDFARDLLAKRSLSHDQMVWVHILAMRHLTPKPASKAVNIGDFKPIAQLFASAQQHLKWPKIHLLDGAGIEYVLSVAGATSRNAGNIYVKTNDNYAGRIDPEGNFHVAKGHPESVAVYLRTFAQNPAAEAAKYGKLTGNCSFCHRPLSDLRSTNVGYGPICAQRYSLPWG